MCQCHLPVTHTQPEASSGSSSCCRGYLEAGRGAASALCPYVGMSLLVGDKGAQLVRSAAMWASAVGEPDSTGCSSTLA